MRKTPGLMSVACLLVVAGVAQERPLPEREAFLRETRKLLQTDTSLQSSYVYVEPAASRSSTNGDGCWKSP